MEFGLTILFLAICYVMDRQDNALREFILRQKMDSDS